MISNRSANGKPQSRILGLNNQIKTSKARRKKNKITANVINVRSSLLEYILSKRTFGSGAHKGGQKLINFTDLYSNSLHLKKKLIFLHALVPAMKANEQSAPPAAPEESPDATSCGGLRRNHAVRDHSSGIIVNFYSDSKRTHKPSNKSYQVNERVWFLLSSDDDGRNRRSSTTAETGEKPKKNHVRDNSGREHRGSSNPGDGDGEKATDSLSAPHYAVEIFEYMKTREGTFRVDDYLRRQSSLSKCLRFSTVKWIMHLKESFKLHHETLYLSVKIFDLYLSKVNVEEGALQLVGAASLLIANKFDNRVPLHIGDILCTCEENIDREDVIKMEMKILRVIGFDLGIPLSYAFLRRFATCCKSSRVFELATHVLDLSLTEYNFAFESESKLACAALYLALRLRGIGHWTPQLENYSGYKLQDFMACVFDLNDMLFSIPKEDIKTVKKKYFLRRS